jgi:hypothetical protein
MAKTRTIAVVDAAGKVIHSYQPKRPRCNCGAWLSSSGLCRRCQAQIETMDQRIDKATEAERVEAYHKQIDAAFARLQGKVESHTQALERIGEQDMGLLNHRRAGQFHAAVTQLRKFADSLKTNDWRVSKTCK